jgi:hypothetical protein
VVLLLIGLFHAAAPAGMLVLVVVWLPLAHTHFSVSPICTLGREAGEKLKLATVIV